MEKKLFFLTLIMSSLVFGSFDLRGDKFIQQGSLLGASTILERVITGRIASESGGVLQGVKVVLKGTTGGTESNQRGDYLITVPYDGGTLVFSHPGFKLREIVIGRGDLVNVSMQTEEYTPELAEEIALLMPGREKRAMGASDIATYSHQPAFKAQIDQENRWNTEEYDAIHENIFHDALRNPLSTFSIDVDAASYSNVRRFISSGQRPPMDVVRIEEMINYFDYDYEQPRGEHPFSIYSEVSAAPWNPKHKLVHIGLQGREIPTNNLPPSNLVFLLDVSGSMDAPGKLPLLKSSFKMLVEKMRPQDRVAIVVYAGAAGLVLPSTCANEKDKIIMALDRLEAGGSTAGGAGIRLAYAVARDNYIQNGNNRVIIATDGDFNVGESNNAAMERLIEEKREDGVFLTVLGFGMGNYKDSKMETLADKGNGNYAYIDTILEAQKVLVNEFGGTLFTIAKDVKLQIEFNPARVQAYRLIGYENRTLKNEDFNNDKKDAGDLGSGHTVTALYEIIPIGAESEFFKPDGLKYQSTQINESSFASGELMNIKFRYKNPDENTSKLITHALPDKEVTLSRSSENFRWSAAVASFGMLLRESEYLNHFSEDQILQLAYSSRSTDRNGYRIEFINMVKAQRALKNSN